MNVGDLRALPPRVPLVAMCTSTLSRLQLHLDGSIFLKGIVVTANPMATICGIEGTLLVADIPLFRFDIIADHIPLCL